MFDLSNVQHHRCIKEIVDVLCKKTQNTDREFFQVEVAYFLGKLASSMRANIFTKDRGNIPVNIYALALATSGFGKGHSVNIMEEDFISPFKKRFLEITMPLIAEKNLMNLANKKAIRCNLNPQEVFDRLRAEYKRAGAFPFTFDSGTSPAVKQLRHKLLMAGCGSINLQIDEIGSNLIGATDVLNTFLELYDQGLVKQKLVKNTAENIRGEDLDGKTPTNMLLFGTPVKLLDGSLTEDQFYSFLETGYARRCLFAIGHCDRRAYHTMSPEAVFARLTDKTNSVIQTKWSDHFATLADPSMYNWTMTVSDPVSIKLIAYKLECEKIADTLPDHAEIQKAELSHRYFKALKLAGVYAFVDKSKEVTMDHLLQAILLVEESGKSFQSILQRRKAYMKLAKYIATVGTEVTHADLTEALPFFKSGTAARNEMMNLAIAWGHKNHIIIKKSYVDGIEFFKGETLEETDINKCIISYSDHEAYNYRNVVSKFDNLGKLFKKTTAHWCNHHMVDGHRATANAMHKFNLIVLDIDGGVSLKLAEEMLKEYKFVTYTTKRHTEDHNRFRMVIPMNYCLELDPEDYKEFMNNIMDWLPFESDVSANEIAKKWMSYGNTTVHYNDGKLLDVLKFIPRTSKNEQYKKQSQAIESLSNLERWFAQRIAEGNRNNNMIRYALILARSGMSQVDVENQVKNFNKQLSNPLPESELEKTIFVTLAKKYSKNE